MSNFPPPDESSGRGSSQKPASDSSQHKLHAMLAGIWERSKKTVAERTEILREAQSLALKNQLDEPTRMRAVDAAHKLAGVLGTFGLPRGTELAREAEETFGQGGTLSPGEIERLDVLLNELDGLIRTAGPFSRNDHS